MIAVIAWMAGMLYLPRLFVYHADAPGLRALRNLQGDGAAASRLIINPAMIVVLITGIALAYMTGYCQAGWLHAKIVLVLGLGGVHGYFARCVRAFAEDPNKRPARFYRILNEVPTVLMVLIVFLVGGEAILEPLGKLTSSQKGR